MMEYIDFSISQKVVNLQTKYTLYKRVINIISSVEFAFPLDLEIAKKAMQMVYNRNDCLRIKIVKKDKKLMQYFREHVEVGEIPYLEFTSEEDVEKFVLKIRKHPIKYKKGVMMEPYFLKVNDKYRLLTKVCHYALDTYGLQIIYQDFVGCYEYLKDGKPLTFTPGSFADLLKKELSDTKKNVKYEELKKFYTEYFQKSTAPTFVSLAGPNQKAWAKQLAKCHKTIQTPFLGCDTKPYMFIFDKDVIESLMHFCEEKRVTLANALFYCYCVALTRMNNDAKHIIPLEMINCRGKLCEKNTGGTMVQAIVCSANFDFEKSFEENLMYFVNNQNTLYRHLGFPQSDIEMLLHDVYGKSLLRTYYPVSFSLIPYKSDCNYRFRFYSNGKCALVCYMALMLDIDTNTIQACYDAMTKYFNEAEVKKFHENVVLVIKQVCANPQINLKEIKVE